MNLFQGGLEQCRGKTGVGLGWLVGWPGGHTGGPDATDRLAFRGGCDLTNKRSEKTVSQPPHSLADCCELADKASQLLGLGKIVPLLFTMAYNRAGGMRGTGELMRMT